ncbi:hypothetical protein WA158_004799 [Blastocystis sp. Blastoise]
MLHNYGGQRSLYGGLYNIGSSPIKAHGDYKDTMVGTGMTPEAIEHNPIVYDLMNEMGWRDEAVDVDKWVEAYINRNMVVNLNLHLPLGKKFSWSTQVIAKNPSLAISVELNRNVTNMIQAFEYIIKSRDEYESISEPWKYDLVDISRQSLEYIFTELYLLLKKRADTRICTIEELIDICNNNVRCAGFNSNGFIKGNTDRQNESKGTTVYVRKYTRMDPQGDSVKSISKKMLEIIKDTDRLLGTNLNFLLGVWTRRAASFAKDEEERRWLDFNAKNQVTLWGPNGEINDYATKTWNGLVGVYHYNRWTLFFDKLIDFIDNKKQYDWTEYQKEVIELGRQWDSDGKEYPNEPIGDSYLIAKSYLKKYVLDSTKNYKVEKNTILHSKLVNPTWSTDIHILSFVCNADIQCKGFTSDGLLFDDITSSETQEGIDAYIKM